MDDVIPGILHWKVKHPNIGVEVSSYLLTDSATVLDPILPADEGPEWLGHDVERVILTVRHHRRSAPDMGVPVFVHRSGLQDFEGDDFDVRGYDAGDEMAPGVRVLPFGRICPDDAVLHIALGSGALAFGDGIMNYGGLGHPPDHGARCLGRRRAVRRERLADAPGRVRLPGQRGQRRQVGDDVDVGQAGFQAAINRDHVPHRGGVVDGAAERQAVLHGGREHVEQHVTAAVHADQVGIGHPDHIHALRPQPLADGWDRGILGGVRHGRHASIADRMDTNDPGGSGCG
jgi:hypothetical protein